MPKNKTRTNYRDAETGQYISKEEAEKHPKNTVKETDRVIPKKQPASKKEK